MSSSVATHEPGPAGREAILQGCLDEFACVSLTVTGVCMEPALREGQSVTVSRAAPRLGDIVLVKHAEALRLHRLIWRSPFRPRGWRTKADRSWIFDPAVGRDEILGVVDARAAGWKNIAAAMRSLARAVAYKIRGPAILV